jgi:hypothetical protein
VARAVAIATGLPYQVVYDAIDLAGKGERVTRSRRGQSGARTGVYKPTIRRYMAEIGWRWVPTMHIGRGCTVHLRAEELPTGRLVVSLSKHVTAVVNGVIRDTYDPSRGGTRCVYGYFRRPGSPSRSTGVVTRSDRRCARNPEWRGSGPAHTRTPASGSRPARRGPATDRGRAGRRVVESSHDNRGDWTETARSEIRGGRTASGC